MKKNIKNKFNAYFNIIKKSIPINFITALILTLIFYFYALNSKKFEIYSYLTINHKDIFNVYRLDFESISKEIEYVFRDSLNNKKKLLKNNNIFLGPSQNNNSLYSNIKIRTRIYGENLDLNLFDKYILESLNETSSYYEKLLNSKIKNLEDAHQISEKIFQEMLSVFYYTPFKNDLMIQGTQSFNELVQVNINLLGLKKILENSKLIDHEYKIESKNPKIIFSSVLVFVLLIILFNFIIGIYFIGRSFI